VSKKVNNETLQYTHFWFLLLEAKEILLCVSPTDTFIKRWGLRASSLSAVIKADAG
jgi:hypothetical protein